MFFHNPFSGVRTSFLIQTFASFLCVHSHQLFSSHLHQKKFVFCYHFVSGTNRQPSNTAQIILYMLQEENKCHVDECRMRLITYYIEHFVRDSQLSNIDSSVFTRNFTCGDAWSVGIIREAASSLHNHSYMIEFIMLSTTQSSGC